MTYSRWVSLLGGIAVLLSIVLWAVLRFRL